jgi:mono/diheme cytochrome c family protein
MRYASSLMSCALGAFLLTSLGPEAAAQNKWTIPAEAKTEKSPLQPSPAVLKKGKGLFDVRCAKCHGATGVGNGPDARPNTPPKDLTKSSPKENPDGVMYFKVWNGQPPIMPAFKTLMTKDEVWTVIEYAKSLRK